MHRLGLAAVEELNSLVFAAGRARCEGLEVLKMRWKQLRDRWKSASGQSLIETALLVPLILLVTFNAINFGYYFLVALHLASAPRAGVQYSILGDESAVPDGALPAVGPSNNTGTVSYLAYQDMSGLTGTSGTAMQVCSIKVGALIDPGTSTQHASCTSYGAAADPAFPAATSDPESPLFVLHRVDVQYTVTPLIGGMSFKFGGVDFGLLTPGLTFHRQVSMRAIN